MAMLAGIVSAHPRCVSSCYVSGYCDFCQFCVVYTASYIAALLSCTIRRCHYPIVMNFDEEVHGNARISKSYSVMHVYIISLYK